MKTFRVSAVGQFRIVTLVEAENEEEAERIASDRDVDVCIHGSEYATGNTDEVEFTLEDGCCESFSIEYTEEQ